MISPENDFTILAYDWIKELVRKW